MHAHYKPQFRAEVVAYYRENGLAAAARKYKVCRTTVRIWARAAGIDTTRGTTDSVAKAVEAAKETRIALRTKILTVADQVLDRIAADAGARDCQALATAFGILLDKYRLENGESTSRSEHLTLDQVEQELQRILSEG